MKLKRPPELKRSFWRILTKRQKDLYAQLRERDFGLYCEALNIDKKTMENTIKLAEQKNKGLRQIPTVRPKVKIKVNRNENRRKKEPTESSD